MAWPIRSCPAAISFTRINRGTHRWNSSRMCCAIVKANPGLCAAARPPRWTSSYGQLALRRSIWKSINGECLRCQLHDVGVKRSKALVVSAGLSILFLVVYGGCNWITSSRSDVGTFYFEWERGIPFVPFLILPYMSIDLFFIAAPFLCRTNEQLRVFSQRVTAAILVAGICFLLFPLRFAFPRPHSNGWTGALFDWFRAIDAPYNLFPSLHAALWLLLVDFYARRFRAFLFTGALIWLALVGLSPALTYQHHLIDILGGFALAGYCFYFFYESSARLPVTANPRIGLDRK